MTLAPLRHPPFRRFWIGAALSNIGTWMETVALGYYVADQTGWRCSAVIAAAGCADRGDRTHRRAWPTGAPAR